MDTGYILAEHDVVKSSTASVVKTRTSSEHSSHEPIVADQLEHEHDFQAGGEHHAPIEVATVLVIDDHPLYREGIISRLSRETSIRCCGEADDLETGRQRVKELRPNIVIIGFSLGGHSAPAQLKALRKEFPSVRLLVVVLQEDLVVGETALKAGAHGLITKTQDGDDLICALETILRGEIYLNPALTAVMLKKAYFGERSDEVTGKLSSRELQVFGLLGLGLGTREIASKLNLSRRTVNVHRENIKHKLGLKAAHSLVYSAITWMQTRQKSQADISHHEPSIHA
jgi:DNA-binding NarL/FixJ family response regulator